MIFATHNLKILGEKRFLVLGFGGTVMIGMLIPFVNFIILPCTVAGETIMYVEHFQQSMDVVKS